MQIFSFSPFGYEGALVAVEVDLRRGIPSVDVVGLADGAVKESRERMRAAIRNSGFEFPLERVLISLSPADLKKEGAGFDLALALAVLGAGRRAASAGVSVPDSADGGVLVMGELELSGAVRAVRAVHSAVATAAAAGISRCIVPAANAAEAREVPGVRAFGAASLAEAFAALSDGSAFSAAGDDARGAFLPEGSVTVGGVVFPPADPALDFADVRGQRKLVRALAVAAAGGHNVLAFGPPGCGKTLALQRFPGLLPALTVEEAQSVSRIHSIAGLLPAERPLVRTAPFRMPHQTASMEGMCGGGAHCRPGEISLAHNGALFLDEAAEFKMSVLQMLRVPLESGTITLSRAGRSTTYPAKFQLLMAANPCPCGNFGAAGKVCLCSAHSVEHYWRKFSGPLLDRVDIRVAVGTGADSGADGVGAPPASTAELRALVAAAVAVQRTRQGKRNAELSPQEVLAVCALPADAQALLDGALRNGDFSQRAASGILKLSRTLADMVQSAAIRPEHVTEAISLRADCGPLSLFSSV